MFSSVKGHALYRLNNAPVLTYPFPHVFVEDIFPLHYWREMSAAFPRDGELKPITQVRNVVGLEKRWAAGNAPYRSNAFWQRHQKMFDGCLSQALIDKFSPWLAQRFGHRSDVVKMRDEYLFIRDEPGFGMGPHTDSPRKVISCLFYLPIIPELKDSPHCGTTLYTPKDPAFRCAGGPHHNPELFDPVMTMPYVSNCLFAFVKSDVSFHGVEVSGHERRLLLFDIFVEGS